ncbi:MAG TPA: bifunctional UDP-N-acetylglucosamine diphosphorylase/glucosamine-1-phosphate N-acetyltransferase GlmU [Polyangiales bacterium]
MSAEFVSVILAAGQGTRMKSDRPKVLHAVAGLPMYAHVVHAALRAGASEVVLVTGHGRDEVERDVRVRFDAHVSTAVQEHQIGTGDAVRVGVSAPSIAEFDGYVVVLYGDTPLVHVGLIEALMARASESDAAAVVLTSTIDDPTGYGRILRDAHGHVIAIREHKDASSAERDVREINCGLYAFKAPFLRQAIAKLASNNAQGELYLTDVIEQAAQLKSVSTLSWAFEDVGGVNDRAQLAACETAMRLRIAQDLGKRGVTIRDPATTYIELGVRVEPDAILEPNVHLRGKTVIAAGAHIDTGCVLKDVQVASGAYLKPYTVASESEIGENVETGPFAHLRPQSVLEADSKVGNFVETKKTRLGRGSKASHLSYLGDGQIGRDVNIGAGTIFCNYDGVNKNTTTLEDGVFIGSDSQLIAPVRVGERAYVATGTAVTRDVPAGALAISRGKQLNKDGYADKIWARLKALKAAKKG